MFTVIGRMWRKKAIMSIVVETDSPLPRPKDVRGVITKEHIADSVADSIKPYADGGGML
jgi:CIC family chloride channel protein